MDESGILQVSIFGSAYTLACDDNAEYLRQLAAFVDGRMSELARLLGEKTLGKVAILTALNIADELFKLQKELQDRESQVAQKSVALISLIEDELAEPELGRD